MNTHTLSSKMIDEANLLGAVGRRKPGEAFSLPSWSLMYVAGD